MKSDQSEEGSYGSSYDSESSKEEGKSPEKLDSPSIFDGAEIISKDFLDLPTDPTHRKSNSNTMDNISF